MDKESLEIILAQSKEIDSLDRDKANMLIIIACLVFIAGAELLIIIFR